MNTLAFPFLCKSIADAGLIEGIAAAFGNVDHGGDRVMPGAFTKTLAARGGRPVPMLLHHDHARPAGAWTDLVETGEGLVAKGRLTLGTRDGAEAHALARDGALTGLSIGYVPKTIVPAGRVRELHAVELMEVSLVAVPMNDRTRVTGVKSVATVRDLEELLRDGGLSSRKAKAAAAAAWKAINDHQEEDRADAELARILSASAKRLGF